MTEEERLAKRRFEAGFVFEMMPDPDPGPSLSDWLTSFSQTLNAVGDSATIQEITIRVVRPLLLPNSWWIEAEITYNDGSKTKVI
jgi:hypothetical protein